jgi:hypothetical protein
MLANLGDAKMLILNCNTGSEGGARLLHRLNLAWALAMNHIPRRSAGLRAIDLTSKEVESPWGLAGYFDRILQLLDDRSKAGFV